MLETTSSEAFETDAADKSGGGPLEMRPAKIRALDRASFYAMFVLEHFIGRDNMVKLMGGARQRLKDRMLETVKQDGVGRKLPLDRRRNLSKKEFIEKYARPGVPVVFEGVAKDWTCVKKWSLDYFSEEFGDDDVLLTDAEGTNSNPLGTAWEYITLRELIENIDGGGLKYARFHPLLQVHPELREDMDIQWLRQHMYGRRTDWMTFYTVFLGGKGTNTAIHNAANDNLFMQIEGQKRWLLYPVAHTPVFDIEANRAPYKGCDLIPDEPDFEKYPMYRHVDYWETVLEPGDVLYNPPYVWHHVTNLTRSIGVGCRWTNVFTAFRRSPVFATMELFNTRPNLAKAILMTLDDFNKVLINTKGREAEFKKFQKKHQRA